MATTTHRRIARKELKRPDEFVTFFETVGDFLQENLARVILVAVAVVALFAVVFAYSFYSQHQGRIRAEDYYQASYALEHKNYKAAGEGFAKLADTGGELGRLAQFYLANTYLAQNQTAKARIALEAYLNDAKHEQFRQLALVQLGVVDENLGDYTKARDAYTRAATVDGPEKERAQLGVARMLVRLGDKAAAIAAYQRFMRENPFAIDRAAAAEALAQLGVAPEQRSPVTKTIEIPAAK